MDRRIIKSKQAIGDAMLEILQKKNFSDITITELSKHAGVDRKTFYAHYNTTNDVLIELEDDLTHEASLIFQKMKSFDVSIFIDGMTELMFQRFAVYTHIAKNNDYSFLLQDGKDILAKLLIRECAQSKSYAVEEFEQGMTFLASGIIDHFKDWLATTDHSKEDLNRSNEVIKRIVGRELEVFTN